MLILLLFLPFAHPFPLPSADWLTLRTHRPFILTIRNIIFQLMAIVPYFLSSSSSFSDRNSILSNFALIFLHISFHFFSLSFVFAFNFFFLSSSFFSHFFLLFCALRFVCFSGFGYVRFVVHNL